MNKNLKIKPFQSHLCLQDTVGWGKVGCKEMKKQKWIRDTPRLRRTYNLEKKNWLKDKKKKVNR